MKKMSIMLSLMVLLAGCGKKTISPASTTPYYMSAVINGLPWKIDKLGESAFHESMLDSQSLVTISGIDQGNDTICRLFEIHFYFVPQIGTYYFNNTGNILQPNGIIAVFSYDKGNAQITKSGTGGYVNITSITNEVMQGSFTCTLKGYANDTTTTIITNGLFSALRE